MNHSEPTSDASSAKQQNPSESLKQRADRFIQLAEQLPGITYIVDLLPAPCTTYISPQVYSVLGFTQEEWLSSPRFWIHRLDPEDRERVIRKIHHHDKTGTPVFLEYRVIARNGEKVWIRNSATYQRNAQGEIATVHGVLQDVTAEINAKHNLQRSETHNRALINAIPDLIFTNDLDGHYLSVHTSHPELLLARPAQTLNRHLSDILPPDTAKQCLHAIQTAIRSRKLQELQYAVELDGSLHHFEARIAPLTGNTALTIVRDITQSKQAEQELMTTKQSYQDLLNSITESIYVQDRNGIFIDVNKGAELMYGYSREELIGKKPADVAAPGRNDLEHVRILSEEVMATGHPVRFQFWARRKNGEIFPKEIVVSKGRYFDKDVLFAVARDISDRFRAEKEKEKLQMQLAQSQKLESVGRLAGGIAHDFNNMLQAIFGNAELALDTMSPDNPAFDNVEEIRKTARRSAELTRQLLAFARKQSVSPRVLNLNQVIEGMIKMLKRLIGDSIQLELALESDLPPVKMDPSQVDQILVNLCLNARDSMKGKGFIRIATRSFQADRAFCREHVDFMEGKYIELSIRDNGAGMEAAVLQHIFEPFFSTKQMGHGTGLGLATIYGIIQQNNGIIQAESQPGKGSTFHVCLPVTEEPLETEHAPAPVPTARSRREHILLVEDHADILKLTATMLEQLGYSVTTALSPGEAIHLAREHPGTLDLLLTDVVMSGMNGHALAKEIQLIFPHVHCLFMSGYTADLIEHHGFLDKDTHFFQKPFTRQQLAEKVRNALDE